MERMKDSIAVLIPTFNRAEFIEESIQSIINQTYKDKVAIFVYDDGSTDNTIQLISKYPVNIISRKENKGVAYSRNVLLQIALMQGFDYFAWQDSDDISDPRRFEYQMKQLKESNSDICFSNMLFFQSGRRTKVPHVIDVSKYRDRDSLYQNTNFATAVFNSKVAMQDFNQSLRRKEDIEWIVKLIDQGIKFTLSPEFLYNCRRHKGRLTYENRGSN